MRVQGVGRGWWWWGGCSLLLAIVVLAGLACVARVKFGALSVAIAYLRGERLVVEPREIWLGEREAGTEHQTSIAIHNFTGGDVHIIGSQSSCSTCVSTVDAIPLTIKQNSRYDVPVTIALSRNGGDYNQKLFLITDCPDRAIIEIVIRGHIKETGGGRAEKVEAK